MITRRTIQFSFLFALFALAIGLSFFIFKPYLTPIVLGGMFAIVCYPLFEKFINWVGQRRRGTAASLTVITTVIVVLIPIALLSTQVIGELNNVYTGLNERAQHEQPIIDVPMSDNSTVQNLQVRVQGFLSQAATNIDQYIQRLIRLAIDNAGQFFQRIAEFTLAGFIWLLAFYYFLRDGHRIRDLLIHFSPLSDRYDREIMHRIALSVKSVIGGTLIVAVIQGLLAGIGLGIFGVPNPSVWGLLAVITALLPTVGTALVMFPAVLYLVATNEFLMAGGLLLWALILVGGIDNILRPKLIEQQIKIHPLAILLSVLGGIAFFGPIGFLIGPIVLSMLIELLNVYKEMAVEQHPA